MLEYCKCALEYLCPLTFPLIVRSISAAFIPFSTLNGSKICFQNSRILKDQTLKRNRGQPLLIGVLSVSYVRKSFSSLPPRIVLFLKNVFVSLHAKLNAFKLELASSIFRTRKNVVDLFQKLVIGVHWKQVNCTS